MSRAPRCGGSARATSCSSSLRCRHGTSAGCGSPAIPRSSSRSTGGTGEPADRRARPRRRSPVSPPSPSSSHNLKRRCLTPTSQVGRSGRGRRCGSAAGSSRESSSLAFSGWVVPALVVGVATWVAIGSWQRRDRRADTDGRAHRRPRLVDREPARRADRRRSTDRCDQRDRGDLRAVDPAPGATARRRPRPPGPRHRVPAIRRRDRRSARRPDRRRPVDRRTAGRPHGRRVELVRRTGPPSGRSAADRRGRAGAGATRGHPAQRHHGCAHRRPAGVRTGRLSRAVRHRRRPAVPRRRSSRSMRCCSCGSNGSPATRARAGSSPGPSRPMSPDRRQRREPDRRRSCCAASCSSAGCGWPCPVGSNHDLGSTMRWPTCVADRSERPRRRRRTDDCPPSPASARRPGRTGWPAGRRRGTRRCTSSGAPSTSISASSCSPR